MKNVLFDDMGFVPTMFGVTLRMTALITRSDPIRARVRCLHCMHVVSVQLFVCLFVKKGMIPLQIDCPGFQL